MKSPVKFLLHRAFCIVGLSYKATTSYAGGDKNL